MRSRRITLNQRYRLTGLFGALLIATSTLSGCVGLEVANAVVQTGNTAVSDLVSAERMTVVSNELDSATPATYKPYVYRKGQDCLSSAFVVPYDRTWPEEVRDGDSVRVLPPEPGKIAGYISVIYRKSCPGVAPESILRAGRQQTVTGTGSIFTRAFSSDNTTYFMNTWDGALSSRDMTEPSTDKPKWWPQVVGRLITLAATDNKVRSALIEDRAFFIQATPEHASALQQLTQ